MDGGWLPEHPPKDQVYVRLQRPIEACLHRFHKASAARRGRAVYRKGRNRSSATRAASVFVGVSTKRSSNASACSISARLSASEMLGSRAARISSRHSLARAASVMLRATDLALGRPPIASAAPAKRQRALPPEPTARSTPTTSSTVSPVQKGTRARGTGAHPRQTPSDSVREMTHHGPVSNALSEYLRGTWGVE